jgi:hypothetical protein
MNKNFQWIIGLSMAIPVAAALNAGPLNVQGPFRLATTAGQSAPVVLELFSSQGCSSCPPAENIVNTWGLGLFQKGLLLPLVFHVDYWNNLGWTDPFSESDFTARQSAYEPVLEVNTLYTPQAVLAGQADAAGNDAGALRDRAKALAGVRAATGLSLTAELKDKNIVLDIKTTGSDIPGSDWVLNIALFENGLSTPVARGENGGRTLIENFVVRSFSRLYPVKEGEKFAIPWDPAWKKGWVGAAVYLQDRRSLRIDSSAAVYPVL